MSYHFSKRLDMPFDAAVTAVTAAFQAKGYGMITTIDVAATLKAKIGHDFRPYVILGACNPKVALRVIEAEDKAGLMMPCNVVVQQAGDGVEVSVVDPVASFRAVENPALHAILAEVRQAMEETVAGL